MANTPPQLIAGGAIRPRRFVKLDSSEEHQGLEADNNERVIGVSGDATKYAPLSDLVTTNNAAADGDSFRLFGDGDICLLTAGEAVSAGDRLSSDNDGKATTIESTGTTIQHYGAIALQAAAADGDIILVQVLIGSERPALT